MRNWTWIPIALTMFIGLGGCVTTPPKIEGTRYTGSDLSYSLVVPSGWTLYERIPEDIQQGAGLNFSKDDDGLFLFNPSTDGVLQIAEDAIDGNWSDFDDMSESQKQEVASALVDAVLKSVTFPLTDQTRYEDGLDKTHANWKLSDSDFKPIKMVDYTYQSGKTTGYSRTFSEVFMFPCKSDQTCILMLMLGSKHEGQHEDMKSFRALVSSIKAHDK